MVVAELETTNYLVKLLVQNTFTINRLRIEVAEQNILLMKKYLDLYLQTCRASEDTHIKSKQFTIQNEFYQCCFLGARLSYYHYVAAKSHVLQTLAYKTLRCPSLKEALRGIKYEHMKSEN